MEDNDNLILNRKYEATDPTTVTINYDYFKTINSWGSTLSTLIYIFTSELYSYRRFVDIFTMIAFGCTSISTILSVILVTLQSSDVDISDTARIVINVVMAVVTAAGTVFIGLIKLRGWSTTIETYQSYIDNMTNFLAQLKSELSLPGSLQTDLETFISQRKDKFETILSSQPTINSSTFISLKKEYQSSLDTVSTIIRMAE